MQCDRQCDQISLENKWKSISQQLDMSKIPKPQVHMDSVGKFFSATHFDAIQKFAEFKLAGEST
jgi:hypothetical protein